MEPWIQTAVTIIGAMLASSGLWAFIQKRSDKKDVTREMLLGLAHDRILSLGVSYLERGDWITQDEHENLSEYLYKPYEKMGGNGTARRVMNDVNNKLRICKTAPYKAGEKTICDS